MDIPSSFPDGASVALRGRRLQSHFPRMRRSNGMRFGRVARTRTVLATATAVLVSGGIAAASNVSDDAINACVKKSGDVRMVGRVYPTGSPGRERAVFDQASPRTTKFQV